MTASLGRVGSFLNEVSSAFHRISLSARKKKKEVHSEESSEIIHSTSNSFPPGSPAPVVPRFSELVSAALGQTSSSSSSSRSLDPSESPYVNDILDYLITRQRSTPSDLCPVKLSELERAIAVMSIVKYGERTNVPIETMQLAVYLFDRVISKEPSTNDNYKWDGQRLRQISIHTLIVAAKFEQQISQAMRLGPHYRGAMKQEMEILAAVNFELGVCTNIHLLRLQWKLHQQLQMWPIVRWLSMVALLSASTSTRSPVEQAAGCCRVALAILGHEWSSHDKAVWPTVPDDRLDWMTAHLAHVVLVALSGRVEFHPLRQKSLPDLSLHQDVLRRLASLVPLETEISKIASN